MAEDQTDKPIWPPAGVVCFFIGGPWNNQLIEIVGPLNGWRSFRVPIPEFIPIVDSSSTIEMMNYPMKTVEYFEAAPLETGVPVFTCLGQPYNRSHWRFGLRSVKGRVK